jgi:hypothetical protein
LKLDIKLAISITPDFLHLIFQKPKSKNQNQKIKIKSRVEFFFIDLLNNIFPR